MVSAGKWSNLGRWEYWVGILGIVLAIALAAAVVYYWEFVQALEQYGYAGAFLISLLGGATILAPIPMTPVVFALGTVLKPHPSLPSINGNLRKAIPFLLTLATVP